MQLVFQLVTHNMTNEIQGRHQSSLALEIFQCSCMNKEFAKIHQISELCIQCDSI